jgi:hypothetical protein
MLATDEIILKILMDAKSEGNDLLKHFKINYPSNRVAEESNSIFIASVDSEANNIVFDAQSFVDRVEVLIVTKNREYQKAIRIIKTVSREIIRLVMVNQDQFPNKPIVERVTPEYNQDYVLTRGHILFRVNTEMDDFDIDDEMYTVCQILTEDMDVIEE